MDTPSQEEPFISSGPRIADRFRGFLPVVIDVETGGFNKDTDALLEIAAVFEIEEDGTLVQDDALTLHVERFRAPTLNRPPWTSPEFSPSARSAARSRSRKPSPPCSARSARPCANNCARAVLVGHNAHFDHGFMQAAAHRQDLKRNPSPLLKLRHRNPRGPRLWPNGARPSLPSGGNRL